MGAGPEHGRSRHEQRHLPPPPAALAWVAAVTGGAVVGRPVALRGGTSSAVHRLVVRRRDRRDQRLVLRRYALPHVLAEDPGLAGREVRALRLVAAAPLPTPPLLACDLAGEVSGVPMVLMGELPGRVVWRPRDRDRWLAGLIGTITSLASVEAPTGELPSYAPYPQRSYDPPGWAADRSTWERAVAVFHGPPPAGPTRVIHRDLHPGNVLWRGGEVSGVVDWQAASLGPAAVDVGHCRMNLLLHDPAMADRLVLAWEAIDGRPYDRRADVGAIVGLLDELRRHPPPAAARVALESALARAVAEAGG